MAVRQTTPDIAEAAPPARQPDGAGRPPAAAATTEVSFTWELELLISGAVLFALFHVPGALTGLFERLSPHATRATSFALTLAYMYTTAMVYALIAAFVLHLAARAYWVGLIGLHAVYPHGVRWERLTYGPVARSVYQERLTSLPSLVARTDRFCSIIFSFGFVVVIVFAISIVVMAVLGGIAYGVAAVLFEGRRVGAIFNALAAVLVAIPMVATLVDRRFGDRLDSARPCPTCGSGSTRTRSRGSAASSATSRQPGCRGERMCSWCSRRRGRRGPAGRRRRVRRTRT